MIVETMKKSIKGMSFQNAAEDLNRPVENVQPHWNLDVNTYEVSSVKKGDKPSNEEIGVSVDKTFPRREMQVKLVSLRKLALFWDASKLSKKLLPFCFNKNEDDLNHVVRIYDVSYLNFNGQNAHHFYEFTIPYDKGYWFVKGLLPSRCYIAEMGVKSTGNKFFPLLRSNSIQTPKFEITLQHPIYHDVFQLHQYEEKPQKKYPEHVSTYSYYVTLENLNR